MDWDVVVAGGGIAGAAAAFFLRREGCRVVVLEKEKLPRYKACAGAVPLAAQKLLPFSLEPVIDVAVSDIVYSLRQEKEYLQSLYGSKTLMVRRSAFDKYVLDQSGAEIVDAATVVHVEQDEAGVRARTEDGRVFSGRYLIGADGANSRVARALGLRRNKVLGVALEVEAPATAALMDRFRHTAWFEFGATDNGYLWIFPKSDHLSVGIGSLNKTSVDLLSVLRREMARVGLPLDGLPWCAHPLPVHLRPETLHAGRCLLVGDAAGLVDAFLGEGIRYGILSGRLAADAIVRRGPDSYSREVKRNISDGLRRARFAARVFYRYPDLSYHCVTRNPAFTRAFLDLLAGNAHYRDLSRRLPLYFLRSFLMGAGALRA